MNALQVTKEDEEIMDQFLDKIKNEYKDAWTEENWEQEMENHPFFMTKLPENEDNLPPAVEAIRQIKWDDDDTPKEKAIKMKEEGNFYYKVKNYKKAIESYTSALKENIEDEKELMSVLHSNRGVAHYYLKNYRSALNDCLFARKFNPQNLKPIYKGAECCLELKKYADCIQWCEMGLNVEPDNKKLRDIRSKAEAERKAFEKDQRKKEATERKKVETKNRTIELIKSKGIRTQEKEKQILNLLENPINPEQKVVCVAEDGESLNWPVIFLYPEFGQTDFISAFNENSTFEDHLNVMFSQPPEWDVKQEYTLNNIRIYYENRDKGRLVRVKKSLTLLESLKLEGMIVQVLTPNFLIMVKNSDFEKLYLSKFDELH